MYYARNVCLLSHFSIAGNQANLASSANSSVICTRRERQRLICMWIFTPFRWIQGFTNKSIEFVDNKTVCYTCGSHVCFLHLETKQQNVFQSPVRGIGILTANGNNGVFAFSEHKLSPAIFVYIFPEFQLKNKLKGKRMSISCMFSPFLISKIVISVIDKVLRFIRTSMWKH